LAARRVSFSGPRSALSLTVAAAAAAGLEVCQYCQGPAPHCRDWGKQWAGRAAWPPVQGVRLPSVWELLSLRAALRGAAAAGLQFVGGQRVLPAGN